MIKITNTNTNNSTNTNNNANINNNELVINLLEAIKDELKGKEYNELVEIAKNEQEPAKAKSKILEKIMSWGGDTASNIVANILTNPAIWEMFRG